MSGLFLTSNAIMPTTAAQVALTTGTAIKTHQQLAPPTGMSVDVVAFGVEFDAPLTVLARVELIETDVAATVSAAVAAGVMPYDSKAVASASSLVTLGTTATGYAASGEGSITAVRYGKYKLLQPGDSKYEWEWSLGREFCIRPAKFGRIRITTSVAINAYTWILHSE